MRALGYNVWLHKYLGLRARRRRSAGFAGVFWAYYNGFVSPADVQLVTSVETLLMVALGGPGTLVGPALGAAHHRVPQELRERLHQALAAHPGRRLHRRHPVRPAGRRRRPARTAPHDAKELDHDETRPLVLLAVLAVAARRPSPPGRHGPERADQDRLPGPADAAPSPRSARTCSTGTELYLDEIGRQVGGRKIELIVEDTEGTPASALTKSRKLVEQDKVHVLTGGLLAHVGYALQPFVDGSAHPSHVPGHRRRRHHPAQAGQVDRAHGLDHEPADASLRRVGGQEHQVPEGRRPSAMDYAFG